MGQLIDVDRAKFRLNNAIYELARSGAQPYEIGAVTGFIRWLNTLPAVDAVPVTRCKDCYHFMEYTPTYSAVCGFDGACRVYRGHTTGDREGRMNDDFCSRGRPLK